MIFDALKRLFVGDKRPPVSYYEEVVGGLPVDSPALPQMAAQQREILAQMQQNMAQVSGTSDALKALLSNPDYLPPHRRRDDVDDGAVLAAYDQQRGDGHEEDGT